MNDNAFVAYNNDLFGWLAPHYHWLDKIVSRVREDFVAFVGAPQGSLVLDVATGTGEQAFAFARAGHSVRGVDLSPAMLSVAQRNNTFSNASFEVANGSQLPFEAETFDVTTMSFAMHCMTNDLRTKVLRELARVTKKAGVVGLVDYGLPTRPMMRTLAYLAVASYETKLYRAYIRTDLFATLRAAGLEVINERKFALGAMRMLVCRRVSAFGATQ